MAILNLGLGLQGSSGQSISENMSTSGGSSHDISSNISNWTDWSSGNSVYQVFGSEASAKDKQRTAEANAKAEEFWKLQANYNAEQAQLNRAFQEYMSNTAYQRAMRDLEAAGLNPILAAGNAGATTPGGSAASAGLQNSHKAQTFPDVYGSSSSASGGSGNSSGYSEGHSSQGSKSYGYELSGYSNNIKDVTQTAVKGITSIANSARRIANAGVNRDNAKAYSKGLVQGWLKTLRD